MSRTRTIGPRNRRKTKKKVRFALTNTPTQDRARRIKKKRRVTKSTNWERTGWKFSKSRNKYGLESNKFCTWKRNNRQGN